MRIVIELKRDAKPEVVKNNLFKYTQLATTFGVNMVALCGKQPRLMNLYEVLNEFSYVMAVSKNNPLAKKEEIPTRIPSVFAISLPMAMASSFSTVSTSS